jgi:hypothetical protein
MKTLIQHVILFFTLILFANIALAQTRTLPVSDLRAPTWRLRTSCLTETRDGKKSCWGVVLHFEDARFKPKISPYQLKIYEAKHGTSLLRLMTWRVSRDRKELVIKFKRGRGDFGTGNQAEITLYKTVFTTPPKDFPDYAIFVQNTDVLGTADCARLTRASIEQRFGKPVNCAKHSEGFECFGPGVEPIKVQFDSSDVVIRLELSTSCIGLQRLTKLFDEIFPKNARGDHLKASNTSSRGSCQIGSQEESGCVTITYFQELCMDCAPASIQVVWK